ncbi:hypothetical protein CALCODRAFT_486538 [Calocera cornea HHB12733]|uniref:Pentacotripeptide-repeat region of PRORP domain-containing protein n=1 Tax=Calocera cornea HHB12733 TaxID=1353952 RepID=A0A165DN15_9BASI|nr:hypothetical protein CALCODRAFT_486538 [Calocera cornea HHB12733]
MLRPTAAALPAFLASAACRRAALPTARHARTLPPLPPPAAPAGPSRPRPFSTTAPTAARYTRQARSLHSKRARKRTLKRRTLSAPALLARRAESQRDKARHSHLLALAREEERAAAERITKTLPEWSDEELERVWQALVESGAEEVRAAERALPSPQAREREAQVQERGKGRLAVGVKGVDVVRKLYQRLLDAAGPPSPNAPASEAALQSRLDLFSEHFPLVGSVPPSPDLQSSLLSAAAAASPPPSPHAPTPASSAVQRTLRASYPVALARIRALVAALHGSSTDAVPRDAKPPGIRLPVASKEEWSVLLTAAVWYGDRESVKEVFGLMRLSGYPVTDMLRREVLESFARQGGVQATQDLLAYINKTLPDNTKLPSDYVIKALAHAGQLAECITQLHALEGANTPAAQDVYALVISSLLARVGVGAARTRALAWDLFAHMRFVAHPRPSAHLYSVMIRACALGVRPLPERAQDLFTEMTADAGYTPTTEAYNALILVLARSKRTAPDAFRLLQEMIQRYRDEPAGGLRPDRGTYRAIFESTKRLGDLARARWLLAELLQDALRGGVLPDEEMVSSVFQTYAAYKVPYVRAAIKLSDKALEAEQPEPAEAAAAEPEPEPEPGLPAVNKHAFTPIVPQSHGEVLREVEALMTRVLEETARAAEWLSGEEREQLLFKDVALTTRLWNSFQSVHWAHAPLEAGMKEYHQLLTQRALVPNARTYLFALERCAYPRREERAKALDFARRVWVDWVGWLAKNGKGLLSRDVPAELGILASDAESGRPGSAAARVAERCWAAMIRITALNDKLDEALSLVRVFMRRFPPVSVREPQPVRPEMMVFKPLLRAPQADRGTVEADDGVPPNLFFRDVELLHHRLVSKGRWEDVGYIKWAVKAYEGGLLMRKRKGKEAMQETQEQNLAKGLPEPEDWESDVEEVWEEQDEGAQTGDIMDVPAHLQYRAGGQKPERPVFQMPPRMGSPRMGPPHMSPPYPARRAPMRAHV